jgi:hypothetical protein
MVGQSYHLRAVQVGQTSSHCNCDPFLDIGLAALQHFGQKHLNIEQITIVFFITILSFGVQIIVPQPTKIKIN